MAHDLHGIYFNDEKTETANDVVMTNDGLIPKAPNLHEEVWSGKPTQRSVPTTKFAVKVNGQFVSMAYATYQQAATHVQSLPPEMQMVAEVVSVDENLNQLLLG